MITTPLVSTLVPQKQLAVAQSMSAANDSNHQVLVNTKPTIGNHIASECINIDHIASERINIDHIASERINIDHIASERINIDHIASECIQYRSYS